jgi:hypothetical protein
MNRVDRSEAYTRSGMTIIGDRAGAPAPPAPPEVALDDDAFVPKGLRAWAGRTSNGFYVQGLVDDEGTTYISAGVGGQHQTFEVPRDKAHDAFEHPYAYGCTILL